MMLRIVLHNQLGCIKIKENDIIVLPQNFSIFELIHPKKLFLRNNRRLSPTIDDATAGDDETILDEYDGELMAGNAVNFATNCTGWG